MKDNITIEDMQDNITIEDMEDNITIEDMEDNITIEDIEDDIKPILKREPHFDIIHVGVNNGNNIITSEISNKLHVRINYTFVFFISNAFFQVSLCCVTFSWTSWASSVA